MSLPRSLFIQVNPGAQGKTKEFCGRSFEQGRWSQGVSGPGGGSTRESRTGATHLFGGDNTATKAEVKQLTKIAKYWKYAFVLLAQGKISEDEKGNMLYLGSITVDCITEDMVEDFRSRL